MTTNKSPADERKGLLAEASALVEEAKDAGRDLTKDEVELIDEKMARVDAIDAAEKRGATVKALRDRFAKGGGEGGESEEEESESGAKTLGDHFLKSGALGRFREGQGRRSASATEFKAATDPFVVGSNGQTQYGRVVETALRRPVVADLLSSGALSATSLTYYQQGAVTGAPTSVAEGGTKPSINFAFTPVTEALTKIAAVTKVSDEATEDTDYIVSVINSQLILRLQLVEEDQILNGNGTAPNLRGILNRSGIQTHTSADVDNNADALFHGLTLVSTGAFLPADGIVINPTDYEALRLSKDLNGQYFGGGFFQGPYGNGEASIAPPLWGVRTVVTPAIAVGTALVGAFAAGAQLFRKGGIRVESTNSDQDDFVNNRVAIRAEERILLAVYVPAAFVKVTLEQPPVIP